MNIVQKDESPRVGPSRYMEIGLSVLVTALLGVSIIGIAYVYGFNLNGNLLDNISAAVRALGVDGGFFLGLYFSRRHWTREKAGWWDGLKAMLAGVPWFVVAMIMAGVSWLSNTLFVNGSTTIITQDALDHAGITIINAQQANWMIGGIPLLIILLYSIVPSQVTTRVDARTPEEIEKDAKAEAARIRAQNMVAAAKAEGAGQRLRTVVGGLVGEALNLEERTKRDERRKQMRIALETAGYDTSEMSGEQVEIQSVACGVWNQKTNMPIIQKEAPLKAEDAKGATLALQVSSPSQSTDLAKKATLTVQEVSQLTLRKVRTINDWCKANRIPRVRKTKSGAYRIPRASLVAIGWITEDGTPTNFSNSELAAISPQMMSAALGDHLGNGHSAASDSPPTDLAEGA